MTTPEQARQQADKAEDADWFVSQKMLRDLARQVEELQPDAERWRRLVNASEMTFPALAIADDPENDCRKVYGRASMEKLVDMMDEIWATYPVK